MPINGVSEHLWSADNYWEQGFITCNPLNQGPCILLSSILCRQYAHVCIDVHRLAPLNLGFYLRYYAAMKAWYRADERNRGSQQPDRSLPESARARSIMIAEANKKHGLGPRSRPAGRARERNVGQPTYLQTFTISDQSNRNTLTFRNGSKLEKTKHGTISNRNLNRMFQSIKLATSSQQSSYFLRFVSRLFVDLGLPRSTNQWTLNARQGREVNGDV